MIDRDCRGAFEKSQVGGVKLLLNLMVAGTPPLKASTPDSKCILLTRIAVNFDYSESLAQAVPPSACSMGS